MWEVVRANRIRSVFLLSALFALLLLGGWVLAFVLDLPAWVGIGIAGLLWVVLFIVACTGGDHIFLRVAGAQRLEDRSYCPVLFNVVEEMAIAGGVPVPEIWLIDTSAPNAFATGRTPEKGKIAVTTGLLQLLSRDELQGVVAHELGHIKNRDTYFMMLAGVAVGGIGMLSEAIGRLLWVAVSSRGRRSGNAGLIALVLGLAFAILGPIFATLFYLALSRRREYLADATAAVLTRYPEGLASALEKIERGFRPMPRANKTTAPLFIVCPLRSGFTRLWSTHPSTEERVSILRGIGRTVSWNSYQEAWRRRTGANRLFSDPVSRIAGMPVLERAPSKAPVLESPKQIRRAARALAGYWALQCPCGLSAQIPGSRTSYECPRCGTQHRPQRGIPEVRRRRKGATECPACHRRTPRWRPTCVYCSAPVRE